MVEKIRPHVKVIAFPVVLQYGIVLIQIECDHIFEWQFPFFMHGYKLLVNL